MFDCLKPQHSSREDLSRKTYVWWGLNGASSIIDDEWWVSRLRLGWSPFCVYLTMVVVLLRKILPSETFLQPNSAHFSKGKRRARQLRVHLVSPMHLGEHPLSNITWETSKFALQFNNLRRGYMLMIAFITIKSSLVPLIEGVCSQIYFRFETSVVLLKSQYTRFSTIGWKQLVETTTDKV